MYRLIVILLLLTACGGDQESQESRESSSGIRLQVLDVLGGTNAEGFLKAEQPRDFIFPQDHAGHPGFRNEWWYLTGNLEDTAGRRFGYQLTFFRIALMSESAALALADSAWAGSHAWMAHAALTDPEGNRHIHLERFSRENPGLAGVQLNPFKVWLENWSLTTLEGNDFPWILSLEDAAFSLNLSLQAQKMPVLQGLDGLSQKSPEPGFASYYYSLSRLQTEGTLTLDGENYQLQGSSWLDREWGTSALAENQSGWDWFSLQFNDGQELMYYQLRDRDGFAHANSQGNWTSLAGEQSLILSSDIILQELKNWRSPAGISYTTEWLLAYRGRTWLLRAIMEDQFMDLAIPYWEGAIDILDAETQEVLGWGYLEMVRE